MLLLKPILAVLGYIYFGFFAGVAGWFLGGIISTVITDGPKALTPSGRLEIQQTRQTVFLKTLFILMGGLAKADSKVSQSEIDHIEQFMVQMGMTGEHRKQAIDYFQAGVNADFEMQSTLTDFMQACGRSLQMKHLLLTYLSGVALADGELHPTEHTFLLTVAQHFGYSERAFEQLMSMILAQNQFRGSTGGQYQQSAGPKPRRATNTLEEAYQALGVTEQDSARDIKRAYRKLISQYHPDKLIGQGVPEDMIKKATERSKEIQAAHDLIVEYRKEGN